MKIQSLELSFNKLDWIIINQELLENGFVIIQPFLTASECKNIKTLYNQNEHYRSTINMKRYNFGRGSYRYFKYPLPNIIQSLRENIYEKLVGIANFWSKRLKYGVES